MIHILKYILVKYTIKSILICNKPRIKCFTIYSLLLSENKLWDFNMVGRQVIASIIIYGDL